MLALKENDVSGFVMRMTSAFLKNRQMQFRVGRSVSSKRGLSGGAPQGTLMGNYLFILTTDGLGGWPGPNPGDKDDDHGNFVVLTDEPQTEIHAEQTPRKAVPFDPLNENMVFSTPTTRGQFALFDPALNDNEEDDSFVYFNPHR